jgi:hypothetical protein
MRCNYGSDRFALRKRLRRHNQGRTPVIHGCKLLVVLRRHMLLFDLGGHRRNTLLA